MKKLLVALLICFSLLPNTSFALECDIIATGFGNSSYNGTYEDMGSLFRGNPQFYNGYAYLAVNSVAYDPSIFRWILDVTPYPDSEIDYYRDATGPGSWLGAYTGNAQPTGGTMTEDCGGGGEEPPPVSGTIEDLYNTVDETFQEDLNFSFGDFQDSWKDIVTLALGNLLGVLQMIFPYVVAVTFIIMCVLFVYKAFVFFKS